MDVALYYPWIYLTGGIERTILEIVQRSRHRWTLYTNYYDPATTYPELARAEVVELERVPVGRDLGSVLCGSRTIRRQKVDLSRHDALVVCSEGRGDLFVLNHHALPALCLCFTPLRTFHDPVYRARHLAGPVWKRPLFRAMEAAFNAVDRRAWRLYDHVFCISEEVRRRVVHAGLRAGDRLEVLYPGVDAGACVPTGECEPFFLLPGRIAWTKNLELGIEAFRRFRRPGKDPFRLVIAGSVDAKGREYFASLRQLAGGESAIEFVLSPADAELQRLYQRCYAVLFTALNEDWGLVPLEAMAYEKPVVAVDQGGPRESILPGETGLLVEPDPDAFADGLRTLADAPERVRAMGRRGREHVRRFSWSAYVARLDEALEECRASAGAEVLSVEH